MKKIFFLCLISLAGLTSLAQADSTLKEYTGRYVFPDGNVVPDVTVLFEGNGLSMTSSAGSTMLEKLGVDSFSVVEFSGTAVFKRNSENKIIGVHIEAAGYVMDGTKEETKLARLDYSSGNSFVFRNHFSTSSLVLSRNETE